MDNLESLLTKIAKNHSEQEKKPSKATYIPAVAGLATGGALAYSGQKGVSKARRAREMFRGLKETASQRDIDARVAYEHALADGVDASKQLHRKNETRDLFRRRLGQLNDARHAVHEEKNLRTKKMLGGLGLLGLGIGTTALLRKRKKNKQMEQEKMSHVNLNHLLTKIAEDENKPKKKSVFLPAAAGTLALGASAGLEALRRDPELASGITDVEDAYKKVDKLARGASKSQLGAYQDAGGYLPGAVHGHIGRNANKYLMGLAATGAVGGGLLLNKARKNRKHNKKMQQKKESSAYSNLRSMAGSLPASMPAGKLPSSIAGSASGMLRGSAAKKGKMLKELKKLPK